MTLVKTHLRLDFVPILASVVFDISQQALADLPNHYRAVAANPIDLAPLLVIRNLYPPAQSVKQLKVMLHSNHQI